MYAIRLDDDNVGKEFSKACKTLGYKQKAVIQGYMQHIINQAEQVEKLKHIDFILGTNVQLLTGDGLIEITHLNEPKND
jgi:hypothetical protein